MHTGEARRVLVLSWFVFVGAVAPAAVSAGDCTVPNTPGGGGTCNVICPSTGNGIIAEVQATGIDVFAELRCSATTDAHVGCGGGGLLAEPPYPPPPFPPSPGIPVALVGPVGLGCTGFARGAFTGVCQCTAQSPVLVTSASCSCQ